MNTGATLLPLTPLGVSSDSLGWFCPLLQSFHIWLFQIYFHQNSVTSLWQAGLLWARGGVGEVRRGSRPDCPLRTPPSTAPGSDPSPLRTGL